MAQIRSVAEMLDRFLEIEDRRLCEMDVKHAPTIGEMYEGLTRSALAQSLPESAGLSITSGFARDADGRMSPQLDAMLVTGEGESIPHTDKSIYSIDNVLAVVEVKKSLYGSDVSAGHENLGEVWRLRPSVPPPPTVPRSCFQLITGAPFPDDPNDLPPELQFYYHLLMVRAAAPVRILLGYHGYKSEESLRQGILQHLPATIGIKGRGPGSFPDVILNRNAAMIKNVGMPWVFPEQDGEWPMLLTRASASPGHVFLEAIWTSLHNRGVVDHQVFGEDLEIEGWNLLLRAKVGMAGCEYRPESPSLPSVDPSEAADKDWTPWFISEPAFRLTEQLCVDWEVDLEELGSHRAESEVAASELERKGIAGRVVGRPHVLRLLTKECACMILPDGTFAVGENCSGRMTRWAAKFQEAK